MKTIETDRLLLREIEFTDVDGMFALDSDPDVQRYLGNRPIKTKQEAEDAIRFIRDQYKNNGTGRWAVIEKATNTFIGWSGIKFLTPQEAMNGYQEVYELGYRFRKEYWGKGYATEAAQAWVSYAFNVLKVDTFYAAADIENEGSISVLEKVGFIRKNVFTFDGSPHYWFEQQQ